MRDILRYKFAVIGQNKAYAIVLASLFLGLFVFFMVIFALPKGASVDYDLNQWLTRYQTALDVLRENYQDGAISRNRFESEKAVYEFFLSTKTAEWMYLKLGSNIADREFACGCYTFAMRFFLVYCCAFGIIGGNFAFAGDFSSGRIKNIWSVKRRGKSLFTRFYFIFFPLFLVPVILLFLFLSMGAVPVWGERTYAQIGSLVYSSFIGENLLALLFFGVAEFFLFFSLSSLVGMASKNMMVGVLTPLLIVAICLAEGYFFGSSSFPGEAGWQLSVIPFASLIYLPQFGVSPWIFFWIGVYLLLGAIFYVLGRRVYAKKAI